MLQVSVEAEADHRGKGLDGRCIKMVESIGFRVKLTLRE